MSGIPYGSQVYGAPAGYATSTYPQQGAYVTPGVVTTGGARASGGYTSIVDGYMQRNQPVVQTVATQQIVTAPVPVQTQLVAARPSGKKQKIVEVIVEKPVIVNKYVDVLEESHH
jgi:hypothetical protein